jgi:hypothetical protein
MAMSINPLSRVNIGSVVGDHGAINAVGVFHGNVTFGTNRNSQGTAPGV